MLFILDRISCVIPFRISLSTLSFLYYSAYCVHSALFTILFNLIIEILIAFVFPVQENAINHDQFSQCDVYVVFRCLGLITYYTYGVQRIVFQ